MLIFHKPHPFPDTNLPFLKLSALFLRYRRMRILLLLILLPLGLIAQPKAQDPFAGKVLDKMGRYYAGLNSFKATYTLEGQTNAGKPLNKAKAAITVQKQSFHISLPDMDISCDGKTLANYNRAKNEVTLADYEPDADEVTPTNIYTLHQRGFKYIILSELKTAKGPTYIIDMEPEDLTRDIAKVRLFVTKATSRLQKWIVYERGTNNRQVLTLNTFVPNAPVKPTLFGFNRAAHKGVRVVDLR